MDNLEEQERMFNHFSEAYTSAFSSNIYRNGISKKVSIETIQKYFSDIDNYIIDIEKLANYYYISSGEVFQLFDLANTLPTLNYKVDYFGIPANHETHLETIKKTMKKVKHKQLTRNIITQTISTGTLTGIWLGTKRKPFLYLFDRVDRVFPAYMMNGEWVVQIDLSYLDELNESEREFFLKTLSPFIKESDYEKYKSDTVNNRYLSLPSERTVVLKTHSLKQTQPFGTSWITTGMFDLMHKDKLKDLEKTIANKIITAIAVLTIGNPNDDTNKFQTIPKPLRENIKKGVKHGLEKVKEGMKTITLPEFAKLEFPTVANTDTLSPEKFNAINNDVESAFGISSTVTRGSGGNYTSGKLSLDIQYKKLAVLLNDIEVEVYEKLLKIILPTSVNDNYEIVYDKEQPLTKKEKTDYLMKLHSQSGFSLKAVVDHIDDVDFNKYVEQSIYEQETLKLQDRIKPYASAYIGNSADDTKKSEVEYPENENTEKNKTYGGNENPTVD